MKTETKSAAPWVVHQSTAKDFPEVLANDGSKVCKMQALWKSDALKDAYLIAAAPELLVALQMLLHCAKSLDQSATHEGMRNCAAIAIARAAISKATNY